MSGDGYAGCDGGAAEEWDRLKAGLSEKDRHIRELEDQLAQLRKIPVGLDTHCPKTMQLVGSALSGGDALALAKKLDAAVRTQKKRGLIE